jgi:hypothetical protein
MAYTKTVWVDRVVQYPTKYTTTGSVPGDIVLTANPGTITQAGTPVNATNLNKIETAIFDMDAKVNPAVTWTTPTMNSPWVLFDSANGAFMYRKDGQGTVWCKGAVKSGTSGSTLLTLPAGFRPPTDMNFACVGGGETVARIKVSTAGVVEINGSGVGTLCTTCFSFQTV